MKCKFSKSHLTRNLLLVKKTFTCLQRTEFSNKTRIRGSFPRNKVCLWGFNPTASTSVRSCLMSSQRHILELGLPGQGLQEHHRAHRNHRFPPRSNLRHRRPGTQCSDANTQMLTLWFCAWAVRFQSECSPFSYRVRSSQT